MDKMLDTVWLTRIWFFILAIANFAALYFVFQNWSVLDMLNLVTGIICTAMFLWTFKKDENKE